MLSELKALIVVLCLAAPVLILARKALCAELFTPAEYARNRNLWLALTLIAFLSNNFWAYVFGASAALYLANSRTTNPLATYFVALFTVPPFNFSIPGPPGIESLIELNHYRLLAFCLLAPAYIRLRRDPTKATMQRTDRIVLLLLIWMFLTRAAADSITGTIRGTIYLWLDIWVPYFVASRTLDALDKHLQAVAALMLACAIAGGIGIFEGYFHWLVFNSLAEAWNVHAADIPGYLSRGDGGPLRALVSFQHPIVFGFGMMLSLSLALGLGDKIRPSWRRRTAMVLLAGGLVASMSRGPWVGAGIASIVFLGAGSGALRRLTLLTFGMALATVALMVLPAGQVIIDHLPFIGTVEAGNIEYRQQLLDVSWEVFLQNPALGDFDYLKNPLMETLRTGQGIIDVVNSYVQIVLPYGAIGLTMFVLVFLSALMDLWRARRRALLEPSAERYGRALNATLIAVMVTIATVSSHFSVPLLYWLVIGMSVGYARMARAPSQGAPSEEISAGRPEGELVSA